VTIARVIVRPIASPGALGFLGLAGATLTVSGLQLGWVEPAETHTVALVVLGFTVPTQLLAAVFGFLARDGATATGMGLLAGIWLAVGLVTLQAQPGSTSDALGLFLLLAGAGILIPATTAFLSKAAAGLVLGTAGLRFLVTGVFQLTASDGWEDTAGVIGVVLCALAVYAALAFQLEDVEGREVLPTGRRGRGRAAIEGGLEAQLRGLEHEAGVRRPL
jgi:uncharacterized protein